MKFHVFLTADAEQDLFDIYEYVALHDSVGKAEKLLEKLESAYLSLENFPKRGHIPFELKRLKIREYLEIHYKPYRIIYQIRENKVFIHCILDGRRNLQDLLQERLLR